MAELVSVLLAWIALQMGLEPPAPPEVRLVPQQTLVQMAYGPEPPAGASVTALYDRATATIFLGTAWRSEDLRDRSTLVHELVHHVQQRQALPYPCLAARERDAYHLQAAWLRKEGVADPYAYLGLDEFTIAVISMCSGE